MKDRINIEGRDGAFAAYIARPKTIPAPAVVVLQELFGVNADIRKHCDELAEQGYLTLAPDPRRTSTRLIGTWSRSTSAHALLASGRCRTKPIGTLFSTRLPSDCRVVRKNNTQVSP
jgi:hypothetical protein